MPACDARLEHVAGALQVDRSGLLAIAEDDEGEMHHDVRVGDELVHGRTFQHVTTAIFDLRPAVFGRVERPSRHAQDTLDLI